MARKKISRKELLAQTDEFITLTQRVINFVEKHPKKFIAGTSAVVILIVLALGINYYFDRQARLALLAYHQAMLKASKLEKIDSKGTGEEIEAVLDALERVNTKYSRTAPGRQVLLDLGTLYFILQQYNQATYTYKKYLNSLKPEEKILEPFILDSLAYSYAAQNKLNEAAAQWEKIVQLPGKLLKEEAFLNLGRVYEKLGQPKKAKAAYRQVVQGFPNSPNARLAAFKIKRVTQSKSD